MNMHVAVPLSQLVSATNRMSQVSRQTQFIDLDTPHPRTSNLTTPSQKMHINSLPSELLLMIFWNQCTLPRVPVLLMSVCRLWHAIVSGSPALWTSIKAFEVRGSLMSCKDWTHVERALTRAGVATLHLVLRGIRNPNPRDNRRPKTKPQNDNQRIVPLFSRCRKLSILLYPADRSPVGSVTMPHLEHLILNNGLEPLVDSIESGSPLLRSLDISGIFPAGLAQHRRLLNRLVHLEIRSLPDDNINFFRGLENLKELVIRPGRRGIIEIPHSTLQNLVSLQIERTPMSANPPVTFPILEALTLRGEWSNILFITAPKLRNLVLVDRNTFKSEEETVSTLRQATIRPISLSTDFLSDANLPELLRIFSNLSELHLRGRTDDCIPGPITTAALAGAGVAAPLCSSLRYLTVHMEKNRRDLSVANQGIQRLQTIVEERQMHGVSSLQRVMCVWDYLGETRVIKHFRRKRIIELEWVDVL